MTDFLDATLNGLAIGAGFGLAFWLVTALRLDRLNQGLPGSAGLAALIAACLAWDGWILVAILGFVAAMVALIQIQISIAAPRRRG